jgi:hypothetical protein
MKNKKCNKCKKTKPLNEKHFSWRKDNNKYRNTCKICRSLKENNRYHNKSNKEKKIINKKAYLKHRDKQLKYKKEFYQNNKDNKSFRKKRKEYRKKYENKRRSTDIVFRIKNNISRNIRKRLFNKNNRPYNKKGKSLFDFAPWLRHDLLPYLKSLFEPWMNEENYGNYNSKTWNDNDPSTWTWQIDHIIPHSEFKYESMKDEEFKKCWALSNLRPLSAKQNFLDGIKRSRHYKNK